MIYMHEHPIVPIIKEHRTLAKLLNSTLGSICSLARLSCVEYPVDFKIIGDKSGGDADESCRINARDFFVPTQVINPLWP